MVYWIYNNSNEAFRQKTPNERRNTKKIVLDTEKKTIIVPWNYTVKLEEINRMVKEFGGTDAKPKTFTGYLTECWEYAMENSDTQLKTTPKVVRDTFPDTARKYADESSPFNFCAKTAHDR
jgi:hypothetical protein